MKIAGESETGKRPSSVVAILVEFCSRYPKPFLLLFALLLVQGTVSALSLLAIVPMADFLFDPALQHPSRITQIALAMLAHFHVAAGFWVFATFLVCMSFLKGSLEVAIRYAVLAIKYTVMRGLIGDTLRTFFKARWTFFSATDQGRLLNTMNKELTNVSDTLGRFATLFAQVVQLAIYLAVPFWLNATMTWVTLALCGAFCVPFLLMHRVSYRLGKMNVATGNVVMGTLNEVMAGARLILGFGRQKQARDRYLTAYDRHVRVTLPSQTIATAVPSFFAPSAMMAVVIAMGVAIHQHASLPELAAVMWSLLACLPTISSLLQGHLEIAAFLPSYEQLIALREEAAQVEEVEGPRTFSSLQQGIELRDVDFVYPGRDRTLSGVQLLVQKGKVTALVGESGSGKSTVTDLILGLQVPDQGQVLIDGVPYADWNLNSFRQLIGYVPQDPLLFHLSLRDNLLWSFEAANEADLWAALRMANADQFVKELPQGLDTIVGDRGLRLSGGQRQRIALAPALLRRPELLILDEATSSLDSESELLIQQSIDAVAKDTTTLVVAHRLSTVANADQVYVLRQGRVVEKGSFKELSSLPGSILSDMIAVQVRAI